MNVTYFDNSARSQLVRLSDTKVSQNYFYIAESKLRALAGLYTTVVLTPETSKLSTIDLWGNVKIPYLDSVDGPDWMDVPQNLSIDGYSSLVGVPLTQISHLSPNISVSFSLESSYIQLQCSEVVANRTSGPDGPYKDKLESQMLHDAQTDFGGLFRTYELPNGTWHGIPRNEETATSWSLGLNRFVDPLWFGGNKTDRYTEFGKDARSSRAADLYRPNLFTNEGGIEAGPTDLLFQATYKQTYMQGVELYFTGYCCIA